MGGGERGEGCSFRFASTYDAFDLGCTDAPSAPIKIQMITAINGRRRSFCGEIALAAT